MLVSEFLQSLTEWQQKFYNHVVWKVYENGRPNAKSATEIEYMKPQGGLLSLFINECDIQFLILITFVSNFLFEIQIWFLDLWEKYFASDFILPALSLFKT